MKWHCFFEQSGTFKKAFMREGIDAEDYDICDDYGCTDNVMDLFEQIETEYASGSSDLFRRIKKEDGIIAFFPCTEFEAQKNLNVCGNNHGMKNWTLEKKLEYDIEWMKKMSRNYVVLTHLVLICIKKGIPLIVENPYTGIQILKTWWAAKPSVIDMDRSEHGDRFKKPTMFFFFNLEPSFNLSVKCFQKERESISGIMRIKEGKSVQMQKSEIAPEYADYFVRTFIIGTK